MGIRRTRLLSVVLSVVVVVLAMSGMAIQASASSVPRPNFSTAQGIDEYLQSRGINPDAVVRQTGLDNYVGSHCPGTGWHCLAPTHTPVVQIAPASGVNVYDCTANGSGSCFALQINGGAPAAAGNAPLIAAGPASAGDPPPGTNQYTCTQTSSANPAVLTAPCAVNQTNTTGNNIGTIAQATTQQSTAPLSATETVGTVNSPITQTNTTGTNQLTVGQASLQSSSDTPTAAQTVYVSQVNGSGKNVATVGQAVQQRVSDAAATQDQEATQIACVTQDSQSGPNVATVGQLMSQKEQDSAAGISQYQNQYPGPFSSCGSGPGTSYTTINPNLASFVLQNQSTPTATGQNQLTDEQSLQQQEQSSTTSGAVNQEQGTPNEDDEGGLEAVPAQTSTAVSKAATGQNEQQTMQASTTGPLSQQQADPLHQPTDEGFQASNPDDTFTLTQTSNQQAGPAAAQFYDLLGDCVSTGTCSVHSTVTNNSGTHTMSCGPTSCTTTVTNEQECGGALTAQPDAVCGGSLASSRSTPVIKASA
jgi:hypothetical protein